LEIPDMKEIPELFGAGRVHRHTEDILETTFPEISS
jgi:hypothetical protein